jgi:arsenate reductase
MLMRIALVLLVLAVAAQPPDPPQQPGAAALRRTQSPTVLFLCPHGAAKSVLASAYFQRAARERGLNVRVITAGTEPDPAIAPKVAEHLKKQGYENPVSTPRRVTADDMAAADLVISIGCDVKGLPPPRGSLRQWDDVPAPSEDFNGADEKIKERVLALVDELVRKAAR